LYSIKKILEKWNKKYRKRKKTLVKSAKSIKSDSDFDFYNEDKSIYFTDDDEE